MLSERFHVWRNIKMNLVTIIVQFWLWECGPNPKQNAWLKKKEGRQIIHYVQKRYVPCWALSTNFWKQKILLTSPSNILPLHLKQTFPPIIWIFTEGEGDGIESRLSSYIFCTLYRKHFCTWNNWSYCGRRTCKRRWRVRSQLTAGLQFWTQISRFQSTPYEPVCDTNGRHHQVIFAAVKFRFSKKATKIDKISILDLTLCSKRQT